MINESKISELREAVSRMLAESEVLLATHPGSSRRQSWEGHIEAFKTVLQMIDGTATCERNAKSVFQD